jgi:hypothetical protein
MRKFIVGVVAGVAVGAASVAGAASQWSHHERGVWCRSGSYGIACIPESNTGYGVGISRNAVVVMNVDSGRTVFSRYQP